MEKETRHSYGNLTNLIKVTPVLMVTHMEGVGIEGSPIREVRTFVTKEGEYLNRVDGFLKDTK